MPFGNCWGGLRPPGHRILCGSGRGKGGEPMDPVSLAGEAAKILVVDVNPRNLQLLSMLLRPAGHRIVAARDGPRALKVAETSGPALVLLEVMMPGWDGFEVRRRLKTEPGTREIPGVFLTARTETADLIGGFEMGAVDYVTKPFAGVEPPARVRTRLAMVRQARLRGGAGNGRRRLSRIASAHAGGPWARGNAGAGNQGRRGLVEHPRPGRRHPEGGVANAGDCQ